MAGVCPRAEGGKSVRRRVADEHRSHPGPRQRLLRSGVVQARRRAPGRRPGARSARDPGGDGDRHRAGRVDDLQRDAAVARGDQAVLGRDDDVRVARSEPVDRVAVVARRRRRVTAGGARSPGPERCAGALRRSRSPPTAPRGGRRRRRAGRQARRVPRALAGRPSCGCSAGCPGRTPNATTVDAEPAAEVVGVVAGRHQVGVAREVGRGDREHRRRPAARGPASGDSVMIRDARVDACGRSAPSSPRSGAGTATVSATGRPSGPLRRVGATARQTASATRDRAAATAAGVSRRGASRTAATARRAG